jgi:hypothetical protein
MILVVRILLFVTPLQTKFQEIKDKSAGVSLRLVFILGSVHAACVTCVQTRIFKLSNDDGTKRRKNPRGESFSIRCCKCF